MTEEDERQDYDQYPQQRHSPVSDYRAENSRLRMRSPLKYSTVASLASRDDRRVLNDVTEAIGDTPLVCLSRLAEQYGVKGRILAKLEYLNPGYSKKDRIAKQIVLDAIKSGELRKGQTVVELTSGNTGTGLAIVCCVMKHPFVAVMSKGNSIERAKMMNALGAEVVLVDQAAGSIPGIAWI